MQWKWGKIHDLFRHVPIAYWESTPHSRWLLHVHLDLARLIWLQEQISENPIVGQLIDDDRERERWRFRIIYNEIPLG